MLEEFTKRYLDYIPEDKQTSFLRDLLVIVKLMKSLKDDNDLLRGGRKNDRH